MSWPRLIKGWLLTLSLRLAAVALAVLLAVPAAEAQPAGRVPRIGILSIGSSSAQNTRAEQVRDELRRLGYVEGQTIAFEIRSANGRLDRVQGLATELVRARVDLIVTWGSPLVALIRPVAGNIPIVDRKSTRLNSSHRL